MAVDLTGAGSARDATPRPGLETYTDRARSCLCRYFYMRRIIPAIEPWEYEIIFAGSESDLAGFDFTERRLLVTERFVHVPGERFLDYCMNKTIEILRSPHAEELPAFVRACLVHHTNDLALRTVAVATGCAGEPADGCPAPQALPALHHTETQVINPRALHLAIVASLSVPRSMSGLIPPAPSKTGNGAGPNADANEGARDLHVFVGILQAHVLVPSRRTARAQALTPKEESFLASHRNVLVRWFVHGMLGFVDPGGECSGASSVAMKLVYAAWLHDGSPRGDAAHAEATALLLGLGLCVLYTAEHVLGLEVDPRRKSAVVSSLHRLCVVMVESVPTAVCTRALQGERGWGAGAARAMPTAIAADPAVEKRIHALLVDIGDVVKAAIVATAPVVPGPGAGSRVSGSPAPGGVCLMELASNAIVGCFEKGGTGDHRGLQLSDNENPVTLASVCQTLPVESKKRVTKALRAIMAGGEGGASPSGAAQDEDEDAAAADEDAAAADEKECVALCEGDYTGLMHGVATWGFLSGVRFMELPSTVRDQQARAIEASMRGMVAAHTPHATEAEVQRVCTLLKPSMVTLRVCAECHSVKNFVCEHAGADQVKTTRKGTMHSNTSASGTRYTNSCSFGCINTFVGAEDGGDREGPLMYCSNRPQCAARPLVSLDIEGRVAHVPMCGTFVVAPCCARIVRIDALAFSPSSPSGATACTPDLRCGFCMPALSSKSGSLVFPRHCAPVGAGGGASGDEAREARCFYCYKDFNTHAPSKSTAFKACRMVDDETGAEKVVHACAKKHFNERFVNGPAMRVSEAIELIRSSTSRRKRFRGGRGSAASRPRVRP